jgi:acetyl esterase
MANYPDAALFRPEAISEETRAANAELARKMASARGGGMIPATPKSPRATSLSIPGKSGNEIPVRVIAPAKARGVFLHLHGGGWTMGRTDTRDADLERIADRLGLAACSVEYRLAPEHRYPAAPDDCEAVALWMIAHAQEHFGGNRLCISGESAGAHLAVLTLLRLRAGGHGAAFQAANLFYGPYDLALTPSGLHAESTVLINRKQLESSAENFLPAGFDRRSPEVSPLYADLRALPPALFSIGTLDPLLDDTLFMHARWTAAGNESELAVYPGGIHAFNVFPGRLAEESRRRLDEFLGARLK